MESNSNDSTTSKEAIHDVAEEGPPISKWRLIALSVSLSLGLFVSFLDGSITATALFTIGEEFNDLSKINWIAISYILADVGCAVTFTTVGDIIGRRNAYIVAFVMFFAFSLGCGFATSMDQLIALRALQGVGGSGLYSLAMVIFPEISPRAMKKWIGAIAGLVVGVSGVSGPILGGIITKYTSWRWIFWINGPICAVTIFLFCVAWPRNDQIIMQHERRRWRELDIIGSFLLLAACVLVVFAFQETGTRIAWSNALFVGPIVAGCVCWVLLACWQFTIWKLWEERIVAVIPVKLFKNRRYMAGTFSAMFMGFPFFVVIYNVPLRVQTVNERNPLTAGVALLPMLGSVAFGSMLGGAISGTKDYLSQVLVAGAGLMVLGTGLLSTLESSLAISNKIYGFQVLCGMGFGLTVSTVSILAAIECDIVNHAAAQGMVAQARVFGGSIGIAASTALLAVKETARMIGSDLGTQLEAMTPKEREAVREAYSDAFAEIMWVSAIISSIAFVFAAATYRRNMPELQDRVVEQLRIETERRKGGGSMTDEDTPKVTNGKSGSLSADENNLKDVEKGGTDESSISTQSPDFVTQSKTDGIAKVDDGETVSKIIA